MKKSQDIEILRLASEVQSLQSKADFYMEKAENSVSREEYEAVIAERDAAIRESEAKDRLHAEERCFRAIAKGRENWLQCGSHKAAKHTAFMYSLVESCRMNGLDFGLYIETVLNRILDGDTDYTAMLPNRIVLPKRGENTTAA